MTPLSSDPNDLLPLTPGHFLIGNSLTSLPQHDLRDIQTNRLSCWELAQQMRQHCWSRWDKEYINELLSSSKWQLQTDQISIKLGTMVMVKDDDLPSMKWKLVRIIENHRVDYGIVTTVNIKKCIWSLQTRVTKFVSSSN